MLESVRVAIALLLLTALCLAGAAQAAYPELRQAVDAELQRALDARIDRLGLRRAVRDQRLAATLVDITDIDHPRVAQVNGDDMMYAASLPKITILLAAFQRIHDGSLALDESLRTHLTAMIRHSSNASAREALQIVGRDYVLKLLQSERYHLYEADEGGGLWLGKSYGREPAFQRDPLHNISHGATSHQVARFYYLLATDRLVDREACEAMREIMGEPGLGHKFVGALNAAHPGSTILRKSGTWRTYHSDSAIIERDGRRYIAVVLANDLHGAEWLSELVLTMDDLVMTPPTTLTAQARLETE
ncbi:MAG: serine hydrolase [Pseudomonadota bacterium]